MDLDIHKVAFIIETVNNHTEDEYRVGIELTVVEEVELRKHFTMIKAQGVVDGVDGRTLWIFKKR